MMLRHLFTLVLMSTLVVGVPASATTVNPYLPSAAEIGGLIDATVNFSGSQLSTHVITPTATGISSAATFEIGTGGALGGEDFSRVVFQGFSLPTDLSAFDSIGVMFTSTVDLFLKPFIQTDDGFSFSENDGPNVAAGVPTMVFIDFDNLTEFANPFDPADVRAFGYQAFGPKPPIGTQVNATIDIARIPEPSTLLMAGLAAAVAIARRRR